jgi:8-oxo-dGTP diphosphatase
MPKTEQEYLAGYDANAYPRPSLTVDVSIFTVLEDQLRVLLIERAQHPFQGQWALPGGFIQIAVDRSLLDAAKRELKEETGVEAPYLEQLATYGNADRDPRGWVATVVYFALLPAHLITLRAGSDACKARWIAVHGLGVQRPLAFDHQQILADAIRRLRAKLEYSPIAAFLLSSEFTLGELQKMHELILQVNLSKKAFRRQVALSGIVEKIPGKMRYGPNRPAQLYRLIPDAEHILFFPRRIPRPAPVSP